MSGVPQSFLDRELLRAVQNDDAEAVRAALAKGADAFASEDGGTLLQFAAKASRPAALRAMVARETERGRLGELRDHKLLYFCTPGKDDEKAAECVRVVLEIPGLDPNRPNSSGIRPLAWAARDGRPAILRALLAACDPMAVDTRGDGEGRDALMNAAFFGRADAVELLLPVSDAFRVDEQGVCALNLAASSRHGGTGSDHLACMRLLTRSWSAEQWAGPLATHAVRDAGRLDIPTERLEFLLERMPASAVFARDRRPGLGEPLLESALRGFTAPAAFRLLVAARLSGDAPRLPGEDRDLLAFMAEILNWRDDEPIGAGLLAKIDALAPLFTPSQVRAALSGARQLHRAGSLHALVQAAEIADAMAKPAAGGKNGAAPPLPTRPASRI
jgi:hypothetical protein